MPATKTKRKLGKADVAIYQAGRAKEGGTLNRVGVMMNIPKNVAVPGAPLPPKKKEEKKKEPKVTLKPQFDPWGKTGRYEKEQDKKSKK